jgi:uncharacterized membrane protein
VSIPHQHGKGTSKADSGELALERLQVEQGSLEISQSIFPVRDIETLHALNPSYADRAMTLLEHEQKRQTRISDANIELSASAQREEYAATRRGTYVGSFVVLIFAVIAGYLVHDNHDIAGGFIGSLDVVAVLSIYIRPSDDQHAKLPPSAGERETPSGTSITP